MKRRRVLRTWAALALAACGLAQDKKKSYTLRGKVEAVDEKARTLTVNHEKVEGWMEAMTMAFEVDKPEVLKKIKVGDRIKATVYDGDFKLYDVEVQTK
jgi:Cu/Ag efflux protein CusF